MPTKLTAQFFRSDRLGSINGKKTRVDFRKTARLFIKRNLTGRIDGFIYFLPIRVWLDCIAFSFRGKCTRPKKRLFTLFAQQQDTAPG